MAESKAESIEVNVTKKPEDTPQRTSREGGYLGADGAAETTDSGSEQQQNKQANHQGRVIEPTQSAKNEVETEADEADEASAADTNPNPAAAAAITAQEAPDQTFDEASDADETTDAAEPTVDTHAAQQQAAISDDRDYRISKKQLKKAPQTSNRHAHKTWVFVVLVTLVSLGLAYGYLTVVEGMSLSEIATKLGL